MTQQFAIPVYLEWVAIFAWALSGAIVGVRRGFDIVGVFVISLLSAFGGGIIRDGLFLSQPPSIGTNTSYLAIVTVAVVVVSLLGRFVLKIPQLDKVIGFIDAIGTPAFCIIGMQLALNAGYPLPGVVLLGVISGTGGGIMRDVLTNNVPVLLQPGQFSTLFVVLACVSFLVLELALQMDPALAGWITVVVFFVARTVTTRFNWKTVAVVASPMWRE
jgi:uncharacterized membrane protein YeiH